MLLLMILYAPAVLWFSLHVTFTNFTLLFSDASAAQDTGEPGNDWNHTRNQQHVSVSGGAPETIRNRGIGSANIDVQNSGKIKFDPPKVPVIFVLGGPGSGKVTHCDTFMQERRGVTHINMMDLLQQYAMGNGEPYVISELL